MAKAKFTARYDRFRALLIQTREAAGLRQVDLAHRLKRPQSYVSKIESGERRLDVVEFLDFAAALQANPINILKKVIDNSPPDQAVLVPRPRRANLKNAD